MSKTSKMMQFINWKMRVTLSDTRTLLGIFLAFDKHMNLVLADTDEYRKVKGKKGSGELKEEKRALGLVLLRGDTIISLSPEAPPAPQSRAKLAAARAGPGTGVAAGRGMPAAPLAAAPKGLAGPVRGVGGPGSSAMMPQASTTAAPMTYARPPPPPAAAASSSGPLPTPPMRPPRPGAPGMGFRPPMPPFMPMMPPGARPPMGGMGFPPRPPMPGMMMRPPPGFPGMRPPPGGMRPPPGPPRPAQ